MVEMCYLEVRLLAQSLNQNRKRELDGLSLGEMKVYLVIDVLYKAELIAGVLHYVVCKAQGREICGWGEGLANLGLHSALCYWSMIVEAQ